MERINIRARNPDQQYTQSPRAEIELIASLIYDSSHVPLVLARLTAQDFTDRVARAIFLSFQEMHRKGLAINATTLAAYMNATELGKLSGGIDLDALEDVAIEPEDIDQYVSLIQDFSQARRYFNLTQEIKERIYDHEPGSPSLDETLPGLILSRLPTGLTAPQDRPGEPRESTADELCGLTLAGPDWMLDKLFIAGGLNLLAGEVSSGKTFLALDLALAVTSGGLAWDHRKAIHGTVMYFCLDCSPQTIQKRLLGLCSGRGIKPPKELILNFSPFNLANAADLALLRQRVIATQARLVIIDVLARYMPGIDENSVSSVGPVMTALRRFTNESGCSILILHHYNKGLGYSPQASHGMRVRGSSDITAAMDAVVTVTATGPRTASIRTITPEKNRDLPETGPLSFSIRQVVGSPPLRSSRGDRQQPTLEAPMKTGGV